MESVKRTKRVKPRMFVNGDPASGRVFLTSGFQAPFQEGDLLKQIDVNSHFQSYATGGSIMHLFTAEEMKPEEQERLIFNIIKNFPIQYLTKTPFLTTCNSWLQDGWQEDGMPKVRFRGRNPVVKTDRLLQAGNEREDIKGL